jgi:hypothetical protein
VSAEHPHGVFVRGLRAAFRQRFHPPRALPTQPHSGQRVAANPDAEHAWAAPPDPVTVSWRQSDVVWSALDELQLRRLLTGDSS